MNQQVKQRIKSSICPKDKWILDKDVNNCFRCDKKFNPIFLRKHHCKICGHIFCAPCSEYFLAGQEIDCEQKQIRMCELCHKKILRYINEHQNKSHSHKHVKDDNEVNKNKDLGDSRATHLRDLIAQDQQQNMQYPELTKRVQQKISILVQIMLKENKIPFLYYQYLVKLILQVVKDVPPNAMTTNNMIIHKHIKIRKSRHPDTSQSKYIIGNAIPLTVFSKRIASKYNSPKIVMIYGGMELCDIMGSDSSFQALLQNRKKQLSNLMYTLVVSLAVNLVLVENNVEKQVLDLLNDNNITVISRVSVSTLNKIKTSLQINKIVDTVRKIKQYKPQDITGTCKLAYLQKIDVFPEDYLNYLIIQGQKASTGLTIIMSGPDDNDLRKIKKQIKSLFVVARHLYLKVSAIIMDQKLIHSKKQQWRKSLSCPNPFFRIFNQDHFHTVSYLRQNYLTYKRIVFAQSDYSIFPQIPRDDYQILVKGSKRFLRKWQQFTEICGDGVFRDENRRFYSEDDWPLGKYLLQKLLNIQRVCERCHHPRYQHIEMYYSQNLYVRIAIQARILQQRTSQRVIQNDDNDINIFAQLAKRKQKHKITHYVECSDCQIQLSSSMSVKQEHLQLSFLAFLSNIFRATNYSNLKPFQTSDSNTCKHENICRVFQLGDIFLKMHTGFLIVAPKYQLSNQDVKQFIDHKNSKYIRQVCLSHRNNIEKIVYYLQDELKLFSDLTKSANFEAMIQNPKASMIKAKTSFVRNSMLTQSQCMQILIPQILQQVQRVHSVSEQLINPKKVESHCEAEYYYKLCANVLYRITYVIASMKKSAQKRELNQKYCPLEDEDADILQNFDLKQLIETEDQSVSSFRRTRVQSQFTQHTDKMTVIDDYNEQQPQKQFQNWISMQEGEPMNRKYRKSESSYPTKKQMKLTQAQIDTIFKFSQWPYKYQKTFVEYLTPNPHAAQSLIASALNTVAHQQCIKSQTNFSSIDTITIKLSEGDNNNLVQQFEDLKKIYTLVDVQEKMMQINTQKKIPACQITILYPQMFQRIRNLSDISIELYIYTIAGVETWITTGGKSGSPFMRAHNDLVIVKKITERQFTCLKKILPQYLKHLEKGSLLAPIYGSYQVIRGPKTQYFIVMQNLFFGMNNWQVYDFKGSKTKRYSKPPVIPLDINFILDRNSQPLITSTNMLADLPKTLQFLSSNNIIDYSLILVINNEEQGGVGTLDGNRIKIGVVDYLRQYGGLQKIQTVFKGLKGNETTVIGANPYKQRMLASITKYFCSLPH